MRKAPEKIFIIEDGKYIEISYYEYQKLNKENHIRRFKMFGRILMEISEKDYVKMNREKSRQQYLSKLAKKFGEFSYDGLATENFDGAMILIDQKPDVYEVVELKIMVDKLFDALRMLSEEEIELIQALFFEELSERQYATQKGVTQVAIHKRKLRVLKRLRSMIDIE